MSSSRTTEDTYEAQNDQRLDELHAKIRTIRGVRSTLPSFFEIPNLCSILRLPLTFTKTSKDNILLSMTRFVNSLFYLDLFMSSLREALSLVFRPL